PEQFRRLAREMKVPVKQLEEKARQLHEANPMLGHRGCRLGVTFPALYEMRARAIFEAAAACAAKGVRVHPEVMIPLVGTNREFGDLEEVTRRAAQDGAHKTKREVPYLVGTMMEVPRACLVAEDIARRAEFFSFGTNDLTQMTYGFSRDDIGKFLPD